MIVNISSPTELSGFHIVYDGSTLIETPKNYGISHLMEHLVCKALDEHQDEFTTLGIDFNAYTSSNKIVFYMTGPESSLSKWRNIMVEKLTEFNVSKEEFENERNIVLQEYNNAFNSQTSEHHLNLMRKKFNHYSAIGERSALETLTYMDCLNFFKAQYLKPSKIYNISKTIDFSANLEFNTPEIDTKIPILDPSLDILTSDFSELEGFKYELNRDSKWKNISLILTSSGIKGDLDILYVKFINLIYSLGLQSPLYKEIREKKGLVYYISISFYYVKDIGYNFINTESAPKNIEPIIETLRNIFENHKDFISEERFNIIKEYLKNTEISREVNLYDSPVMDENLDLRINLDKIKYEKVLEYIDKYFDINKYYISRDDTEFN